MSKYCTLVRVLRKAAALTLFAICLVPAIPLLALDALRIAAYALGSGVERLQDWMDDTRLGRWAGDVCSRGFTRLAKWSNR